MKKRALPKVERSDDSPGCYYVRLRKGADVYRTNVLYEGVGLHVDYDKDMNVIGIEILDFKEFDSKGK